MRSIQVLGRQASVIALGTMDFGGKIEEGQARDFMSAYCEMGGNFLDTARIYGDSKSGVQGGSERVIGRWLEDERMRERVLLGTKGAHPDPATMHTGRLSRNEIMDDIKRSLENLRTSRVDIYWLHRDDEQRSIQDILTTLTEIVEEGYAAHVGVSNWSPVRIAEALSCARERGLVRIEANQPRFSLAFQHNLEDDTLHAMDKPTHELHVKEQLFCQPFSSQAKGFLSKMDVLGEAGLTERVRRRYLYPDNLEVLQRAQLLSRELGCSVGSVALAWLTSQPYPTIPIAGASRMEQLLALKEAGSLELTAAQRDYLRTI